MKKRLYFLITLLIPVLISAQPGEPSKFTPRISDVFHQVGDKKVNIRLFQYGDRNDIVFINLHDNESTSVEAAKELLTQHGGLLIKIENNDQRIIGFRLKGGNYSFDPNRIFSTTGIQLTLKRFGNTSRAAIDEVNSFARKILKLIPGKAPCVVALHNNTDKGFSATDYLPGNDKARDASDVKLVETEDADDFFITTDTLLFRFLSEKKFNTVLQDNRNVTQDGSLSVYFGEKRIPYINCETEHGKTAQYKAMLAILPACIEQLSKRL